MTQPAIDPHHDVAPPPGTKADIWMDAGYRDIYNTVGTVVTSDDIMKCPLVTATARQHVDGSLDHVTVDVDDAGHQPLTAEQARELAGYLIEAAGEVDGWSSSDEHHHRAAVHHYGLLQNRAECSCTWVGRFRWTHTSAHQDLRCHTAGRVTR